MTGSFRIQDSFLLIGMACASLVGYAAKGPKASDEYRIAYATYFGGSEGEEAREVIPHDDVKGVEP